MYSQMWFMSSAFSITPRSIGDERLRRPLRLSFLTRAYLGTYIERRVEGAGRQNLVELGPSDQCGDVHLGHVVAGAASTGVSCSLG